MKNKCEKEEDIIVLFSGGQDSTTCLFWAKQHFRNVIALAFDYGQKHVEEITIARKLAKMAEVEFYLLDAGLIHQLSSNALTDSSLRIDETSPKDGFPNTFVPGRNLMFLSFAAAFAYSRGIKHLLTGVSESDFSGYPDCRNEFILSAQKTISLAMDKNFEIHTPLMYRNKEQVWELADELGVFDLVKNETLTCYNGIKADGCGHCPACHLRKRGLENYLRTKENKQK